MKKLTLLLMTAFLSLTCIPTSSKAETPDASTVNQKKIMDRAKAEAMLIRLDELMKINKTDMTLEEKQSMRREVRNIRHELKAMEGGVYLSLGAIIIIALLLIILF